MISNELYKEIGEYVSGVIIFKNISVVYQAERIDENGVGAWKLNVIELAAGNILSAVSWEGLCNYTDRNETPEFAAKSIFNFVQMVLMFKKFAQVETKNLLPGQKDKGIDCKYVNNTPANITFLTSTWFTNLVKSDAFKVRGHFRLQPKKKDGEWTKELIWIADFQKDGYTAPARKLKELAE